MSNRGVLFLTAALLLGAASAFAGPPDEPIGVDGHYGRVRLGWEGMLPGSGLGVVTLYLENPDAQAHTLRAVVGSAGHQTEETVTLAPGARRRLPFVVPTDQHKLSVSLLEDQKLLATSEHTAAPLPFPTVLLVDGEPGTRGVAHVVSGVVCVACGLDEVPPELGCLAGIGAIVLRNANPARAGEGVRGVLLDYVRSGGTIVVVPKPHEAETRTLWEDVVAPARPRGDLFQEKRHGLGRVLLASGDPAAASAEGETLARALARELDLAPQRLFPRFFTGEGANDAAHRAGLLLATFFLGYFLVAGPFLARRLRGAAPRRVARFVLVLVLAFVGLAVLLAREVRHQVSHIDALTFVVVPEAGEPLAVTEVIVSSGGAAKESVALEGEDVSATAAQRTAPYSAIDYRISNSSPLWTPSSASTRRGFGRHAVAFDDLAVPTLGDVRIHAIASARDYKRLDAVVEIDPVTSERAVRVTNTSGRALGAICVYEATRQGELVAARLPRGLEPGQSATAPITTRASGGFAVHLVGFPQAYWPIGWEHLAPRHPDGSDAQYVLLAEDEPPVRATAKSALVRQRAWRVEAIAPVGSPTLLAGSVGLKVKPSGTGVAVTLSTPTTAVRKIRGWSPGVGTTILTIGGVPVHSQAELDQAFARVPAEGWVEIVTADMRFTVRVGPVLAPVRPRRPAPKPSPSPPPDEE